MITRFVCLANSYKEGGRCVAGIELDPFLKPILKNDLTPKWLRPICNTTHGEVPNRLTLFIQVLDIIEIDLLDHRPELYQSENFLFEENSLKTIGKYKKEDLLLLCENKKYIFNNRYPSLSDEVIEKLTYSLMLIKPENCSIIQKVFEEKTKFKLNFDYHEFNYELPITDPIFLDYLERKMSVNDILSKCILCVSVSIKFPQTGKYYKLVASVIPLK